MTAPKVHRPVIYGLHSGDGRVRYVGLSRNGTSSRINGHRSRARGGSDYPVHRWMRKVGLDSVTVVVLQNASSVDDLPLLERAWIANLREAGEDLLNLTDGGEYGVGMVSELTRARRSASLAREKHPFWGKKLTDEHRAKLSAAQKAYRARTPSHPHAVATPAGAARRQAASTGARNPSAKMTLDQVRAIRASGEGASILADRFGVDRASIWAIRSGRTWKGIE